MSNCHPLFSRTQVEKALLCTLLLLSSIVLFSSPAMAVSTGLPATRNLAPSPQGSSFHTVQALGTFPTLAPSQIPPGIAPAMPGGRESEEEAGDKEETSPFVGIHVGGDPNADPSQTVTLLVLLTVLSLAPSIMIMMTSFTRIVIVISLIRQAMGLQTVPPSQVLTGLALFLSMFVMGPTFSEINQTALQPYLAGTLSQTDALETAQHPIRKFMLAQTRRSELALFTTANGKTPESTDDISLTELIPAFVLSELKTGFTIGFVVFIPFLVVDILVASTLMSMGMMMLPPILVSMPFKLMLFVLVDGWALLVKSLVMSFRT